MKWCRGSNKLFGAKALRAYFAARIFTNDEFGSLRIYFSKKKNCFDQRVCFDPVWGQIDSKYGVST